MIVHVMGKSKAEAKRIRRKYILNHPGAPLTYLVKVDLGTRDNARRTWAVLVEEE